MIAGVFAAGAFGALSYAWLWRKQAALQLRLDRCVETRILEARKIQRGIEAANVRMRLARAAAIATAVPSGGASLRAAKAALLVERVRQDVARAKWRIRQAEWIARRGCDGKGDRFLPLPALRWWRPPDDPLGPQPLEWESIGGKRETWVVRLWRGKRFAQAELFRDGRGWDARWIARAGLARASLD